MQSLACTTCKQKLPNLTHGLESPSTSSPTPQSGFWIPLSLNRMFNVAPWIPCQFALLPLEHMPQSPLPRMFPGTAGTTRPIHVAPQGRTVWNPSPPVSRAGTSCMQNALSRWSALPRSQLQEGGVIGSTLRPCLKINLERETHMDPHGPDPHVPTRT